MHKKIYEISPKDQSKSRSDFSELWNQSNISTYYEFKEIEKPELQYQQEFLDYIAEHGISSLYRKPIVMDAITSPSMQYTDVVHVVAQFLARLDGAKRILIIDPYFYGKWKNGNFTGVLQTLLLKFSSALDEIFIVTNGKHSDTKITAHAAIKQIRSTAKIQDIVTDEFHDRFWIDPDNNVGVVTGTSLNSLGRKIALVDRLRTSDVKEIVGLAKTAGVPL